MDMDEVKRKREELWGRVLQEAEWVRVQEERVQKEARPDGADFLLEYELNRLEVAVLRLRSALNLVRQLTAKICNVENKQALREAAEWLRATNPAARKRRKETR
jgi:hypothetical protein